MSYVSSGEMTRMPALRECMHLLCGRAVLLYRHAFVTAFRFTTIESALTAVVQLTAPPTQKSEISPVGSSRSTTAPAALLCAVTIAHHPSVFYSRLSLHHGRAGEACARGIELAAQAEQAAHLAHLQGVQRLPAAVSARRGVLTGRC